MAGAHPNARRLVVPALLLTVAAVALSGPGLARAGAAATPEPRSARPNIVVIMTDDQNLMSMRVMSGVRSLIAKPGVTFANSVVSWSLCCPSRVTYLTGQYAKNHGVHGNVAPSGGYSAFKHQETTFPVALQQAGYDTVHIGKYVNGFGLFPPVTVPPGWTEFHGALDPTTYSYSKFTLLENGNRRKEYGKTHKAYQTDVYTRLATSAIRARARDDRPFFLNLAYLAPHAHGPGAAGTDSSGNRFAVPAPRDAGRFADTRVPRSPAYNEPDVSDKPHDISDLPRLDAKQQAWIQKGYQKYLGSLLAVDRGVRRIVETLKQTHQLDNTVIVFTSDNGFFFGEHRVPAGKVRFYEPSIRVPLMMRGPGIPHRVTRKALVANIDLAPTILALAHATPLRAMDGESLVPMLTREPPATDRSILLEAGGGVWFPRWGVRTPRFAYWRYDQRMNELYDLRKDPNELHNLIRDPAYAAVVADMESRRKALQACSGASCNLAPR